MSRVSLGEESIRIRDFLQHRLSVPGPANTLWTWLTRTPGVDVTAVFDNNNRVLGATVGFLHRQNIGHIDATYVTLLTANLRDVGVPGIGRYLRQNQIDRLNERLGREPEQEAPSLQIVSLSALPNSEGQGAVGFQNRIFLDDMDFTQGSEADARRILTHLDEAHPGLYIAEVMNGQPVQPMRFIDD